jgi:hypothetical protein
MSINTLIHQTEIEARETVETADRLSAWLAVFGPDANDLDETYVVELVVEKLSDRSEKRSIRIRLAEQV